MPALTPTVIGTFVLSVILQVVGLSLLPRSEGFTRPLPTLGLIVAFIAGIWLMARLTASGVPISILIPITGAVIPLAVVAVGILVYGEPASLFRVALLIVACLLIGLAGSMR